MTLPNRALLLLLLLLSPAAWGRNFKMIDSIAPLAVQKFFDINLDNRLDYQEQALVRTWEVTGWPLANTKLKLMFDMSGNYMLEPLENARYLEYMKDKFKFKAVPQKEADPRFPKEKIPMKMIKIGD